MNINMLIHESNLQVDALIRKYVDGFNPGEKTDVREYIEVFSDRAGLEVNEITTNMMRIALDNNMDPTPISSENKTLIIRCYMEVMQGVFDKIYTKPAQ